MLEETCTGTEKDEHLQQEYSSRKLVLCWINGMTRSPVAYRDMPERLPTQVPEFAGYPKIEIRRIYAVLHRQHRLAVPDDKMEQDWLGTHDKRQGLALRSVL